MSIAVYTAVDGSPQRECGTTAARRGGDEDDDAMFEWAESYYEPFDDDELATARIVS